MRLPTSSRSSASRWRTIQRPFLVAKLNGQVVGTISFGPCGDDVRSCTNNELAEVGELGSIYVLPELQGKGVGSALIAAMANRLHKSGIEQFCLDCGLKAAQEKWKRKFGASLHVAKTIGVLAAIT